MSQGSGVAMSYGVGHRHNSDLPWLCLWHRPAAAAPIGPLAWELPYAAGMALKSTKERKKEREREEGRKEEIHFSLIDDHICKFITKFTF